MVKLKRLHFTTFVQNGQSSSGSRSARIFCADAIVLDVLIMRSSTRLHGLDHLRTLAIVQVFLFHYFILSHGEPAWLPEVAGFGWSGVDLFFVLSGFLISSQLFEQIRNDNQIQLSTYFTKRFFRILPAYWVVVTVYFCVPFFREKEHLAPLWKFLTFTQNIDLNLATSGTFSHAWSLCVEEHFYLLLPLTILLLQRLRWPAWSAWLPPLLIALGIAVRYLSYQYFFMPHVTEEGSGIAWYKYIYYPTWNRLDSLIVGVAIAALRTFRQGTWSRVAAHANKLLLAGVVVLAIAMFLCEDQFTSTASVFGFPIIALGYGLLVASAVCEGSILYRWQSRITYTVATLSYSVYLVHKGVIHMTHVLLSQKLANSNMLLLISMTASLVAAYILYKVVELPFMKLRKKLL